MITPGAPGVYDDHPRGPWGVYRGGDRGGIGPMDPWSHGPLDPWALGPNGPLDPMGPWTHGPLDPWALGPPQGTLGGPMGPQGPLGWHTEKRRKNVVKKFWAKNAEKMW